MFQFCNFLHVLLLFYFQTFNFENLATIDIQALLSMLDNKCKNVKLGNNNQMKCPFCGCKMEEGMVGAAQHIKLNFASPESLELMCLSILHFLLHILLHIRKVGYRWTIKKWNGRTQETRLTALEKVEEEGRKMTINNAFADRGLPIGNFPGIVM